MPCLPVQIAEIATAIDPEFEATLRNGAQATCGCSCPDHRQHNEACAAKMRELGAQASVKSGTYSSWIIVTVQ